MVKLADEQLGWIAADRARALAAEFDAPLVEAEAARNLAVLARRAGWHSQAAEIAMGAAEGEALRSDDPAFIAERGLLVMSAAYTAAHAGDRAGMRELTGQAGAIAAGLGGRVLLRDHGGGFSPAAVKLHLISAEYTAGDPAARHRHGSQGLTASATDYGAAGSLFHRRSPRLRDVGTARRVPGRTAGRRTCRT